jgi:hypothetical protein
MATRSEQRDAARGKAEQLLTRKMQQETERLSNRARDSKALDDKIARLRALRLSKEAADREAAAQAHPAAGKKSAKRA